jgi:import inner membrane translocase subunit TIM44
MVVSGQSQRWNSFIKQVMDQVKRDMENDPKLKKDWENVQKKSQDVSSKSAVHQERLDEFGNRMKDMSFKTTEVFSSWKERSREARESIAQKTKQMTEENESLNQVAGFMRKRYEAGAEVSGKVMDKTKGVFGTVMDKSSKTLNWVGGENEKTQKLKEWKAAQAARDAAREAAEKAEAEAQAKAEAATDKTSSSETATAEGTQAQAPEAPEEHALVVSKNQGGSSWDRFGAGLRDMPFLSNMFDNPLFDRLFGESEIAASIREMKDIDSSFFLEDFAEEIEYVVTPRIVQTYLDGDSESLQLHCGEAAFAAVNASIKARKDAQMTLDTKILAGPKEIELKGAQRMENGPPCFIWTFNTQQVNCLRDKSGEIIEGAVDDIRTVYYAMAVQRHPDLEKTLEYPWQVSELAIVGNQPCW